MKNCLMIIAAAACCFACGGTPNPQSGNGSQAISTGGNACEAKGGTCQAPNPGGCSNGGTVDYSASCGIDVDGICCLPNACQPLPSFDGDAGMADPAAAYCTGLGYRWAAVDMDGTAGVCILPDGTQCEEWSFYLGKCGQSYSFCNQHGGTISTNAVGGRCTLPDGRTCSEAVYSSTCTCG
jgi:putative hemolysin